MSNRTIFLLVVASAVSIFSLWLVWKDGSSYVAMATRDEARHATETAGAGTRTDTTRLFGQRGFLAIATVASADTLTARAIGRAEFVKVDSFDIAGEWLDASRDTLINTNILPIGKNVFWFFTDCVPRVGEQAYLAKVNDSVFVRVWLNLDSI